MSRLLTALVIGNAAYEGSGKPEVLSAMLLRLVLKLV